MPSNKNQHNELCFDHGIPRHQEFPGVLKRMSMLTIGKHITNLTAQRSLGSTTMGTINGRMPMRVALRCLAVPSPGALIKVMPGNKTNKVSLSLTMHARDSKLALGRLAPASSQHL